MAKNSQPVHEKHYQDTLNFDPRLRIYEGGVKKAREVVDNLPMWMGETERLRVINSLDLMALALRNGDQEGASKQLNEVSKLYDSSTVTAIGIRYLGDGLYRIKPEERMEKAFETGADYIKKRKELEDLRRQEGVDLAGRIREAEKELRLAA